MSAGRPKFAWMAVRSLAPVIREPILGGSGQIAAGFKLDEAKELADRLSSGRARMEIEAVD